jgi:hypothetical protein
MNVLDLNKEDNYISVVIHYNSEKSKKLIDFIQVLQSSLDSFFKNIEYIIVFNGVRPDINFLKVFNDTKSSISSIELPWYHNIEDSMRAGIEYSIGDFIYEFDNVYFNLDPDFLIRAYQISLEGFDCVSVLPSNFDQSFFSKIFYKTLNSFSNSQLNTEIFRLITRRMINRVRQSNSNFQYRKYNYHFSGLPITNISYNLNNNLKNYNQFSFFQKLSLGSTVLVYYTNIVSRLSLLLSIIFFLFSILNIGYALLSYIFKKDYIQSGWTTTMIFLSISFSGLFIILAILSKYLQIILRELQSDNSYTFKEVKKMNHN